MHCLDEIDLHDSTTHAHMTSNHRKRHYFVVMPHPIGCWQSLAGHYHPKAAAQSSESYPLIIQGGVVGDAADI